MPKEAVGVPTQDLIDAHIIPPSEVTAGKDTFIPITNFKDLYRFIHFTSHNQEARVRGGKDYDVENDPSFQQLIMYGVVIKDDKVLAYQRGSEKYDENRLAGKISLGVGGHFEPDDTSLPESFYREIIEEVDVSVDGEDVDLNTVPTNARKAKDYFSITPVGIIKDERDDVGKVHLGVVSLIHPTKSNIAINVKADGETGVNSQYIGVGELNSLYEEGQVDMEGWSDIVLKNVLLPQVDRK